MKSGLTISAVGHALFLAWGIVSFAATPRDMTPIESAPVDIISETDFTAITAGVKTAAKLETPKPQVEKVAPKTEVKDLAPKVVDKKPEIEATQEAAAPPPLPEPKPKQKPPEPKPPEAKAEKLEKKPDPIAEAIKQEKPDDKPKPEKDEVKQQAQAEIPTPPKRPPRPQPKPEQQLDFDNIQALLDKRKPQRQAAAGDVVNTTPSLGVATNRQSPLKMSTSNSGQLSEGEKNALMGQISKCWSPPAGAADAKDQKPIIRIEFSQDGRVVGVPRWIEGSSGVSARIAAEAAIRAIRRCEPYTLPAAKYDDWRVVEAAFDPSQLFR